MAKIKYIEHGGKEHEIDVPNGLTVMEGAIKNNIPVTTTIHAMGVFDETHELSLEFLGMHGNVAANYAIQEADLIIALGTRFDDRITGIVQKYAPKAFEAFENRKGGIIHVNKNNKEIGNIIDSHYNFHADCGDFLSILKPLNRLGIIYSI